MLIYFKACHHEVSPKYYHDACVFDACGCDSGGDCECACTAVAAYAAECAKACYWQQSFHFMCCELKWTSWTLIPMH